MKIQFTSEIPYYHNQILHKRYFHDGNSLDKVSEDPNKITNEDHD